MWPPAAATASSLCRNDSSRSDPQYRDFLEREPVAGNHEILSEDHVDCGTIFSVNEMRRSFQLRSDPLQFLVINAALALHRTPCGKQPPLPSEWLEVFIFVLKTSATYIWFCCFHLFSDRMSTMRYKNINSPHTSSRTYACDLKRLKLVICIFFLNSTIHTSLKLCTVM